MKPDEQQIREVVEAWHTATRAGDVDAVLALMTDDVVFLLPGRPPMRKEEFASLSRITPGAPVAKMESSFEIREILVSGDLASMWCTLSVSVMPPEGGSAVQRAGHTLTIFRKQGDRWLLARDANLLSPVGETHAGT